MNKKIILKVLGILGGILIILSVFLPFVKVKGFSSSLWQTFALNKQIYLSIVIMIFGFIPILLNLINKKEEFSFTSVGALSFFLIIETVGVISDSTFSALNLGFYFMLIGTVLVAIATIFLDKESKINVLPEQIAPVSNNISNPLERSPIVPSSTDNLQTNQDVQQNLGLEFNQLDNNLSNNNNELDMLGEEIPDYQPGYENGVNPVVSEFELPEESNLNPSSTPSEVSVPESSIPEPVQAPSEVPVPEVSIPEPVQAPSEVSVPESSIPEPVQAPSEVPVPEVSIPEPVQAPSEVPVSEVSIPEPVQAPSEVPVSEVSIPEPVQAPSEVPVPEVSIPEPVQAPSEVPVSEVSIPEPVQAPSEVPVPEVSIPEPVQAPSEVPVSEVSIPEPVQAPSEVPVPEVSIPELVQAPSEVSYDVFGQPK